MAVNPIRDRGRAPARRRSPGLNGPITILSFDEGPDVAYFDNQSGGQWVEEAAAVEKCEVRFELIRASALSQEESRELLKAILESL